MLSRETEEQKNLTICQEINEYTNRSDFTQWEYHGTAVEMDSPTFQNNNWAKNKDDKCCWL